MMGMFKAIALFTVVFFSSFYVTETSFEFIDWRNQMLNEVNQIRAKGCKCGERFMPPVGALKWNNQLENSAYAHARDMRRNNFFSHTGSDGSTITQRIRRQGYIGVGNVAYYVAENIAYGYPTVKRVVYEWKISKGHCLNMMNPKLTDMGVAELDKFWVQDLGYRR